MNDLKSWEELLELSHSLNFGGQSWVKINR